MHKQALSLLKNNDQYETIACLIAESPKEEGGSKQTWGSN